MRIMEKIIFVVLHILFLFLLPSSNADNGKSWTPDILCANIPHNIYAFFPYENDCTKYWQCFNGNKIQMSCPAGLQYNAYLHICDYPDRENCRGSNTVSSSTDGKNLESTSQTTPDPWIPDDLCSNVSEGKYDLFPYDGDCAKYWVCFQGKKISKNCPEGLWFNAKAKACDYPDTSGCGETNNSTDSSSENYISSTVNPWIPDELCKDVPPGKYALFPYIGNCTKFWTCFEGKKVEKECPTGLWFNSKLQTCDYPEQSGCNNYNYTTTESSPNSTISTTEKPWIPDQLCKDIIGEHYALFPFNGNCSKFWFCFKGRKVEKTCPTGLWFNAKQQTCDYPQDSGCEQASDTTDSTLDNNTVTTVDPWIPDDVCNQLPKNQYALLPYQYDCSKYWICYDGKKSLRDCPAGLWFSFIEQVCDYPFYSNCSTSTSSTTDITTEKVTEKSTKNPWYPDENCKKLPRDKYILLPNKNNCSTYWVCYDGKTTKQICPHGLWFNVAKQTCDYPQHSGCGKYDVTTEPYQESTTKIEISTSERSKSTNSTDECSLQSSERYLLPFIGDCTKYFRCQNGIKVLNDCPKGLWFNSALMICDYPEHSGCQNISA